MSDNVPILAQVIPHAKPTLVSLDFDPNITEEQFGSVLHCLVDMQVFSGRYLPIYLGDALNYGEMRWKETYAQYVDITGLRVELLRDYKWVMGRVPKAIRRENLYYGHYKAVAPLSTIEERAAWLDWADKNNVSTTELREAIKLTRSQNEPEEEVLPPEDDKILLSNEPEDVSPEDVDIRDIVIALVATARKEAWDQVWELIKILAQKYNIAYPE